MKNLIAPEIFEISNQPTGDIQLYPYEKKDGTSRSRISFSKHVFSFIVSGSKEIYNTDKPVLLSSNKFVLIKSANYLMTELVSAPASNYQSVLLFFSDQILQDFVFKYRHLIPEHLTGQNRVMTFRHDTYSEGFRNSLTSLSATSAGQSQDFLRLKFEELMYYLLIQDPTGMSSWLEAGQNDLEMRFRKTVESNVFADLSLEELAFLCNMSLSSFKRHFQKYYHSTPRQWMIKERMRLAKILLRRGERPTDVYPKAGYSTLSNFIKAYRLFHGETPRAAVATKHFQD
ncbi:MAG: AraC family transcriptional regulator [Bacteroidota bacterium]